LFIARRLQQAQAGVGGIQRQLQRQAALHQQVRGIGLLGQRVADQAIGQHIFGLGALLAQSGQKLLELVTFLGGHGRVLGLSVGNMLVHYWLACPRWAAIIL
jgi:hypothetical protein